ncbi:MAG: AAA family ATPase [Gammaproteobacteria bacterium]|nr:AAA family ATPase [Gammaproteobacteria bacterium]
MAFDKELAYNLTLDDRDTAPFFVGREAERRSFADAARRALQKPQAVFRIFQGPPGCGKTSLAARLEQERDKRVLFFRPTDADMHSMEALLLSIRSRAMKGSKTYQAASKTAALAVEGVKSSLLDLSVIREQIQEFIDYLATRKMRVFVHIEEAHARAKSYADTLTALHADGISPNGPEVPCVVLLTGLGHTTEQLKSIPGLSRLSDKAVFEMGGLSGDECAQSTLMMLDRLEVCSSPAEREDAAGFVAELSQGWPQHLNRAQAALCEELIHTGGRLNGVDPAKVKEKSDQMRFEYYAERLDHPPLSGQSRLVKRIVAEMGAAEIRTDHPELRNFCMRVIQKHDPRGESELDKDSIQAIADTLIEKGVLSKLGGLWKLAIPSMGDWALQSLRAGR